MEVTMKHLLTTDDTALAAYLNLIGVEFIPGTIQTEVKHRRAFVFKEEDGVYKKIEEFYSRKAIVTPLDFQESRSQITKWLKNDITNTIKIKKDSQNE